MTAPDCRRPVATGSQTCANCGQPVGDSVINPAHRALAEAYYRHSDEIEKLTAKITELQTKLDAATAKLVQRGARCYDLEAALETAQAELFRRGWKTIGVEGDPQPSQWCVLYDGDSDAVYPYRIVRACDEEWEGAHPLRFWNRHAGDRWLPLVAP